MKNILLICILAILAGPVSPIAGAETDILKQVLDTVGYSRADLGYHPRGYWSRYPLDIPYRLSSFDDLFAEPLKLYDYGKTMAGAVERFLEPSYLDTSSLALYYLTYAVGVERKRGGFRSYSANLTEPPDSGRGLEYAFEQLFLLGRTQPAYYAFGNKTDFPEYRRAVTELAGQLPEKTVKILSRLIYNVIDIIRWRNIAVRNCDPEKVNRIYGIRGLASSQGDGAVYYPDMDDIAATLDYASLHYAALKSAALAEETADSLFAYGGIPDNLFFELATPFGRVILIGRDGLAKNKIERLNCDNSLLVIDFGADGRYYGACGATLSPANPVSLFIDLGGNDEYTSELNNPSAGTGILGVGLLYEGGGNDKYNGREYVQGCGLFGVGVLFDRAGKDDYRAELSGQGCGYFGIGLCFDAAGNDSYYICGDGQGMGGIGGGIGVLGDYRGDDFYKGEPYAEVYNRGDYHSDHKINGNSVQGVGFGRRGDGTDGHAWAGGLGAIIDMQGNDHYLSGNWSLGCAYWFATGIAYDGAGDDIYESCYFTQGSGAHYCNGILIDEGGNDRHELYETAGAGLGFGWDFTNALLVNIGGDDRYRAKIISMGLAQIRSNAFLIDIGGNDIYRLGNETPGLGEATFRAGYDKPSKVTPLYTYCKSFGCFIDIGGSDQYRSFDDGGEKAHPDAADGRVWLAPAPGDEHFTADNFGVGLDTDAGIIPEIEKWRD